MIDQKELRLGNWIRIGTIDAPVDDINNFSIGLQGNLICNRPEQLDGIPLTYEIMKCIDGFVYDPGTSYWDCWKRTSMRSNELVSFTFKISMDNDEWRWLEGNANIPFYYLHQLQNLYFTLTHIELEYKP